MKLKFLTLLFMVGVSFLANAKTFSQDHTVCTYKGESIDFDIRGEERYVSGPDRDYGKVVVIKHEGNSSKVKFNDDGFGRYRMLQVYNEICPKILALPAKNNELAFFVLKDNRPFTDYVLVIYYDLKTHTTRIAPPKYQVKSAFLKDGKAFFEVANDEVQVEPSPLPLERWVSFDINSL